MHHWFNAGAFLAVIFYCYIRIREIRKMEQDHLAHAAAVHTAPEPKNQKWDDILTRISSDNPSDWRLAIIEADTILDEILTTVDEVWKAAELAVTAKGIQKEDRNKKIIKTKWVEDSFYQQNIRKNIKLY